jgi:hypothetical protein
MNASTYVTSVGNANKTLSSAYRNNAIEKKFLRKRLTPGHYRPQTGVQNANNSFMIDARSVSAMSNNSQAPHFLSQYASSDVGSLKQRTKSMGAYYKQMTM